MNIKSFLTQLLLTMILSCASLLTASAQESPVLKRNTANAASDATGKITYTNRIAGLISSHCVSCHSAGEIGPFSLETYTDVQKRSAQIVSLVSSRRMPPWKADSHGEFLDENRLTSQETGEIRQWAEEGCNKGTESSALPASAVKSGWRLGAPDLIIKPAKPYTLAAEGRDEYHTFLLPASITEDRYISAVEVHPGNRTVVHHTIIYADTTGHVRSMMAKTGGTDLPRPAGLGLPKDGILDIWAPGNNPRRLPDGVGLLVPKGADIVMEVHYHRSGKPEADLTQLGFYFCKQPVTRQMHLHALLQFGLSIPAGEAHYRAAAELRAPADATLLNVFPHMHLLGKSMKVTMVRPDGGLETLVDVPDWDFNWQNTYWYKNPVHIQRGTVIKLAAEFDNSKDNPNNPNSPPKLVTWGEQTTNEMCIAFLGYITDSEPGR